MFGESHALQFELLNGASPKRKPLPLGYRRCFLLIPVSFQLDLSQNYKIKEKDLNYFKDIDECFEDKTLCTDLDGYCVNSPGSFKCKCYLGYQFNTFGNYCIGWKLRLQKMLFYLRILKTVNYAIFNEFLF